MDSAEPSSFEVVILPHLDAAFNLARHLTGNDVDAEDVVQSACLRALQYFVGFHGTEGRQWFLAITRNVAYDVMRRRRSALMISLDDAPKHAEQLTIADTDASLHETLAWEQLDSAVRVLSMEFREVMILREVEHMSYAEIAVVTGVPIGTVMSRLSRARRQLRVLLTAPVEAG